MINGKIYKKLAVFDFAQINNWEKTKGVSNWISITFDELKNTQKTDHFGFSFKTENLVDLLNFQFSLIDSDNKKIQFNDNERKVTKLNFKAEVLR